MPDLPLDPCPLCGGELRATAGLTNWMMGSDCVRCQNEACEMEIGRSCSWMSAIERANRRAAPAGLSLTAALAEVEQVRYEFRFWDTFSRRCSEDPEELLGELRDRLTALAGNPADGVGQGES